MIDLHKKFVNEAAEILVKEIDEELKKCLKDEPEAYGSTRTATEAAALTKEVMEETVKQIESLVPDPKFFVPEI